MDSVSIELKIHGGMRVTSGTKFILFLQELEDSNKFQLMLPREAWEEIGKPDEIKLQIEAK